MSRELVTFLLLAFFSNMLWSQSDCEGFHLYNCGYIDYTFKYSPQSKSAMFKRGQTSSMKIVVYGDEEYHIGVCTHRKFGAVHFKVFEENTEKTLIYDNTQDNLAQSFVFSNKVTRTLIIEVTIPPNEKKDKYERRCVGVVVEYKKEGFVDDSEEEDTTRVRESTELK